MGTRFYLPSDYLFINSGKRSLLPLTVVLHSRQESRRNLQSRIYLGAVCSTGDGEKQGNWLHSFWPQNKPSSGRCKIHSEEPLALKCPLKIETKNKSCTEKSYQTLLRSYVKKRCDIQPWSDYFFRISGRRPTMADVDLTDIAWLSDNFREYIFVRSQVLIEAEGHPERLGKLRQIQTDFASKSTVSEFFSPTTKSDKDEASNICVQNSHLSLRERRRQSAKEKSGKDISTPENKTGGAGKTDNGADKRKPENGYFGKYVDGFTKPGQMENRSYGGVSLIMKQKKPPRDKR